MGANRTKAFRNNKGRCLVPEKKIMWEEQFVDPPFDYIINTRELSENRKDLQDRKDLRASTIVS